MIFSSREHSYQQVEQALRVLSEHFECVQILCSRLSPDSRSTENVFIGHGNWFARHGMAKDFIDRGQAETAAGELAKILPPPAPPEEGEQWKLE